MSDVELTLDPIVSRRLKPFTLVYKVAIPGNGSYKIYAGDNLGVPNIWALHTGRIRLVTDATVANRNLSIRHYVDNELITIIKSGNIAANSTAYITYEQESLYGSVTHFGAYYATLSSKSFMIGGDDHILIDCTNGVAGDYFDIRLVMRWLNWELGMMLPRAQKDSK